MGINGMLKMVIAVTVFAVLEANAAVTQYAAEDLEEIITAHTIDYDFILIDIRDDSEVATGIIASEYCKPYHLSWNMGDFDDNYSKIPTEIPVIVYCRSGSRARGATSLLSDAGFETVGTLTGGINAWGGALSGASELQPVSDLPTPSYYGTVTRVMARPIVHQSAQVSRKNPLFYTVTLSGKVISSVNNGSRLPAVLIHCYRFSAERSVVKFEAFRKQK